MLDTDVNVPQASAAEQALQQEQLSILQEQRDIQSKLLPFILQGEGITIDESGNFVQADDPNAALRQEIEAGLLERTQQALAGELPISSQLEGDIRAQEDVVREAFRKSNPTAGAEFDISEQGLDFFRGASEIRDAAARGDLTVSEQLAESRLLSNQAVQQQSLAALFGIGNRGLPLAQSFQQPISNEQFTRNMQFQANAARAQSNAQTLAALFGGAGTIAGSAVGFGGALGKPFPVG